MDINVVFLVYGEYLEIPIIKECINQNIARIQPKSWTILNKDDMSQLCKDSVQYNKYSERGCFASDEARLIYLQQHDHTLYLDADSLVTQETLDFISEHIDESVISGWYDYDTSTVRTCSGAFSYRGANKSELFDEMIKKYEWVAENESKTYTDIMITDFFKAEVLGKSAGLVGKMFDTLVFNDTYLNKHINMTRILAIRDALQITYKFGTILYAEGDDIQAGYFGWYDPCIIILNETQPEELKKVVDFLVPRHFIVQIIPESLHDAFIKTLYQWFPNNLKRVSEVQ